MRRALPRCLVALVLLCSLEAAAERVVAFDVDVHVEASGEMLVVEHIAYDFGDLHRHGIYRDVPVRYNRPTADWRVALDVLAVTDELEAARPWTTSRSGRNLRIRIGDPDRKVTGLQHYWIHYRVSRAVLFFEEHDEIYWNATGNEWRVPIAAASATVTLPSRVAAADLRVGCFTGAQGSRYSECDAEVTPVGSGRFTTRRALASGEGLTLVLGLPKGVVYEPTASERWLARARDFISAATLMPFAALGLMAWLWRRHGRDVGARDAIPVRYEPPEGLTPAEVGTIVDESADVSDVTATIIDLAVRGHLRIHEIETSAFLFLSDTDYRLERLEGGDALKPFEERLMSALFEGGDSVEISDLRYEFHDRLKEIVADLYEGLSSGPRRFFPTAPHKVRRIWSVAGLVGVGLGFLLYGVLDFTTALGVGATGLVIAAFARVMPRRTRRGRRAYEEIVGFREFVERVDADRLERLGTNTQERFEALLPYAVVLGVADAWAEAFAGLATRPPTWYDGSSARFEPRGFVDDLGRCLHSTNAALAARRPSSGSGSSGLGGGGFSGGGFGGGGGGSW